MLPRLALALSFTACVFAQEPDPVFKSDLKLALIPFHVVSKSHFVTTVKQDDIEIFEDGKPRAITYFENGMTSKRTTALELMLVFDRSGSVLDKGMLDPLAFKETLLSGLPNVEISVYSFARTLNLESGPTRDPAALKAAFERVQQKGGHGPSIPLELPKGRKENHGGTWLFESIYAAAKDAASATRPATRMMLVFSDGEGTTTSVAEDAAKFCMELGIPVYPVLLGPMPKLSSPVTASGKPKAPSHSDAKYYQVQDYLRLGELTGGVAMHHEILTLDVTRAIVKSLTAIAITEYVAGFQPEVTEGGAKKHKVQVKLKDKQLGQIQGGSRVVVH